MKKYLKYNVMFFLLLAMGSISPAVAATHNSKNVGDIQVDQRACLFFYLGGVPEADPAIPNQIWFAVPTTHPNYQTFAAMLMSAKLSGKTVKIITDGSASCGYANAVSVSLSP